MRELAKSIFGASWSMSVLGAQQVLGMIDAAGGPRDLHARGFDPLRRLGDEIQASAVDLTGRPAVPDLLRPENAAALGVNLVARSADGLRLLVDPWRALDAAREVQNKLEVYVLVRQVARLIGVPDTFPLPLLDLVRRAYELTPYEALWAVEGLGHDYAESYWRQGLAPRALLTGGQGLALPPESLLMMHAGVGLGIAEHLLEGLGAEPATAEVERVVGEVVALCRDNSRPGFVGAAYESIGLVTRLFHPPLVPAVDAALRAVAPEVVGYFWHGAGRAIYFRPVNFLPGSTWQCFEMARREAPDSLARLNAVAGVTWAFVLVNQRQPGLLADLLLAPHGERLEGDSAFVNGLCSGVIMRADTTPAAPFIEPFLDYRPDGPRLARLWRLLVHDPGRRALRVDYPILRAEHRLGDLFHYDDLARLAAAAADRGGA